MAPGPWTRPSVDCDIHQDQSSYYAAEETQATGSPVSVLGDLPVSNFNNVKPVDSLAADLNKFSFSSPGKENSLDQHSPNKSQGRKAQHHVAFGSLGASEDASGAGANHHSRSNSQTQSLAAAITELPNNAEQLSKHQAGQFEWLLSIPTTGRGADSTRGGRPLETRAHDDTSLSCGDEKRLLFGCNLVRRRASFDGALGQETCANVYTLLATRVEGDDSDSTDETAAVEEMSPVTTAQVDTIMTRMGSPQPHNLDSRRASEVTSRIEDSVEALDKLEEELEALNEMTHLERVLSPETSSGGLVAQNIDFSLKRTGSTAKKSGASKGTVRVASTTDRPSSTRRSVSNFSQDEDKATANTKAHRRSLVARPASLLPPKPPAKSSKPPTLSTFELPGEVVAKRLKEQREARLSRQISPEQAALAAQAYSPSKPHAKSTKPPTRPTFELPGEAISRRKREEREAKLRAQEEEERKRREFKARPIRGSIVPSSYPRETVASRARQGKLAGQAENGASGTDAATPGSLARKRQSVVGTPSQRSAGGSVRGRSELAVDSGAGTSRATSTSTGSIHGGGVGGSSVASLGKRSSVSAEDQLHQKVRGRQIFARDNSLLAERERERREKEAATKNARQEAAERSRQLSREWAEKQKAKREKEEKETEIFDDQEETMRQPRIERGAHRWQRWILPLNH
ncbi:hypothetical protein QBC47DRAFT_419723 [Echria macrotheca]|uniref:Uncharacterized protein n=1 Tax=Echria macrotheca TaxID=438768 RepID=A0AAJ0BNM8_9PEZI|nr:hypothetical protein QBC47DRAFT_419723 [Echria macrotheca]